MTEKNTETNEDGTPSLNQYEFVKNAEGVAWVHEDLPKSLSIEELSKLPNHVLKNARKEG